ncbi:Retrovirus-related Pol polyprotein from transposon TNT 1-94 [Cardamine amara subsp. amara]|uniref:Retrovirus-related Pol polyprotein from transposon TNT 1-94 n=1 Tax=Cardamine amara subsp. amara TaxID=228776 RepID=A0ABD1A4B9_CARAN
MDNIPYSIAIGSIMYAMLGTRCDLAYAVGLVSRFMSKPSMIHWTAVKWVLRYLKGAQDRKIVFRKKVSIDTTPSVDRHRHVKDFKIEGFCDSDYSSDLDRSRSISGYVFTSGGTVISWKSSLQHVVALSTTEAEYMALVEAVKEAIWLKGLTKEFRFKQDTVEIWCDSQSALSLAKNNVYHERTKHINRRLHFIRDIVASGEVKLSKIPTERNPADMLTKVLPVDKFEKALSFVNLEEH